MPEGHTDGSGRRRRYIPAIYLGSVARERGMGILQAPPRATSKRGNGEWWPESPRWRAGRPLLAESPIFFQTLMHACMSLYECTQDVPETPSGALKVHKLCASSKYVVCDHLGCVERRSSGLRVHVYMYVYLRPLGMHD